MEENSLQSITVENKNAQSTQFTKGSKCVCLFFYFLLICDMEKSAPWEKALTKPNRYHAKDCSVIADLRDSPFPGNASHRLE